MCIVLFSYKSTPGYRLVLAANRDEFVERPTLPLAYWQDYQGVLAGRDLRAGGTWLGMHRNGKVAVLTNFREPQMADNTSRSRGELPLQYLGSGVDPEAFLLDLEKKGHEYQGFNMLFGEGDRLYSFSNRGGHGEIEPGLYGLSNHLLDTGWPKVERGKMLLQRELATENFTFESLFTVLNDQTRPAEALLPDTGIGRQWERLLGTIFITSKNYGTRSSAVIIIRNDGYVEFKERTYVHGPDGFLRKEQRSHMLQIE